MSPEIYSLRLGLNRCYIIRDRGAVMVDAGLPGQAGSFLRQLAQTPIRPEEIRLILLTHGHFDHAGSAGPIRQATGAQLAAHAADLGLVEGVRITRPTPQTAWARVMWAAMAPFMPAISARHRAPVDLVVSDAGLSLAAYGIAGRVIHTPGHTAGSLTVLLDGGEAFVGCLAHSGPPFRLHPDLPVFADDPDELRRSWSALQALGARHIYPGHGRPFAIGELLKPLQSRSWGLHRPSAG